MWIPYVNILPLSYALVSIAILVLLLNYTTENHTDLALIPAAVKFYLQREQSVLIITDKSNAVVMYIRNAIIALYTHMQKHHHYNSLQASLAITKNINLLAVDLESIKNFFQK